MSVDARRALGGRLRELRQAAGLGVRPLAAAAHVGRSTICDIEAGRTVPTPGTVAALDRVLNAGGELVALAAGQQPAPEEPGRVARALAGELRPDVPTGEALASVLAALRRADDHLPAGVLLPGVEAQSEAVHAAAHQARGQAAERLRLVAAEWIQFVGWLVAETRDDRRAARLLDQAVGQARELGARELLAQALDFRGWLARQRQQHLAAARWYEAVREVGPGPSQLVNALAHQAHALASAGRRREALQVLSTARDRINEVTDPPATAYWLSPAFARLGVGLALAAAGERGGAAEELEAGLAGLPQGWAEAEWAREYRQALAAVA